MAEGASGADALRVAAELRPDVLVLDVNLPDINGLEVTRRLRDRGDLTPIVILTVHNDSQTVLGLLEAGATGYVLKDEALDRLAGAVRAAARGDMAQPGGRRAGRAPRDLEDPRRGAAGGEHLTRRYRPSPPVSSRCCTCWPGTGQ